MVNYRARQVEAYQHTNTISCQGNKSLCSTFKAHACLVIGVYLAGNEKEIVTNAMYNYSRYQHPVVVAGIAVGKKSITQCPGKHPECQHLFNAKPYEKQRHQGH